MNTRTARHLLFGSWLTLVTAPAAFAQSTATSTEPEGTAAPVQLEEYNVAASRVRSYSTDRVQVGSFRDVDPVDVPITVNVVTREVLDAQAARTIFDALKNTAGVTRAQSNGNTADNFAIRGITVENRGNIRLNGSLPVINLIDLTLENKERVEVLKGAASLYYGFVPPSGIINLVTKRATPQPLNAFTVTANNHGGVTGHVDVSRRFATDDRFGVRINAAAGREDLGIDYQSGERYFGSIALDWKVSERFLLRFDAERLKKTVPEAANVRYAVVAGAIPLPPLPPNTRNFGGSWQENDGKMWSWVLRSDTLVSRSWTLVVEGGQASTHRVRHPSDIRNINLTTGAAQVVTTFNPSMRYSNDNFRAELFGRFDLLKMQHNLSLGYAWNERKAPVYNNGNVTQAQNYFNPTPLPRPAAPTATTTLTDNAIEDSGKYLFDRVVAFNERVQIIGGIRFADYDSSNVVTARNNTTGATTVTPTVYSVKNQKAPMASVSYKPTPKSSVYVSYLRALEPGATAPFSAANSGFVLPPLESRQWEFGAKADLQGVLVQLAYFDIERPAAFLNSANFLTANGLSSYKGYELFLSGEAGRHLSLIASATYLDALQLNAGNAATFNRIPEGTSKYTGSFFAEWRVPGVPNFAVSAGAYYVGRRPLDNSNLGFVGGYTTYTAGASYALKTARGDWTLRVTSDNLSNKNTWAGVGGNLMSTLTPRIIKASLSARF